MEGVVKPFRIALGAIPCVPEDGLLANVALNKSVPFVQPRPPHDLPLAIVGGGPSVLENLDELRDWKGHIWAINGTCHWLDTQGIDSILFTVDAEYLPNHVMFQTAHKVKAAIVSTSCHPELVKSLEGRVRVFHTHAKEEYGFYCPGGGSSSAMRAQVLSLLLGFHDTSYFGCEGSWVGNSHVDQNIPGDALIIRAGKDYITNLQMMLQCEELSAVIKAFPDVFKDRSGGLLRAMISHPDWEVVALSESLRDRLDPLATERYAA